MQEDRVTDAAGSDVDVCEQHSDERRKEELLDCLAGKPLDVLVTFGAGDIDRLVGPIEEMLEKR